MSPEQIENEVRIKAIIGLREGRSQSDIVRQAIREFPEADEQLAADIVSSVWAVK